MGWNPIDDVKDIVEDAVDWVSDTVDSIFHNPLDAIGGLVEDAFKGGLGLITLGQSNKYDLGYWREKYKPDQTSPVFEDRLQTARNTIASREIVYGHVKKGGTVVYLESSGSNDKFLHLIVLLANHPCREIHNIYFNGESVAGASIGKPVQVFTANKPSLLYAVGVVNGGTSAPTEITDYAPASWTVDHALTGCTYLYLRLKYDRDEYRSGIPQITVELDGKDDIYDPRDDSTGYTDNYSLCVLDYMRHVDGMNIPDAEINMQSFEDSADYDDETVPTVASSPDEKRFTVAGVLSIDRAPLEHLEELRKSGGALINCSQGMWRIIPAKYTTPVDSFTESDLIGGISFSPSSSKHGRINTIRGVYIDGTSFERTEFPEFSVSTYVTDDKETLSRNLDLNFVDSPYQCQRLAKIEIERSRYGLSMVASFKFRAWKLQAGQRINLDIGPLGNKTYIVLDVGLSLEGGIAVQLQEDASAIYDWSLGEAKEVTPPPAVNLPNPSPVPPLTLSITEELYSTNNGNAIKTRAIISFTEPADRLQEYEIQYKLSADSNWIVLDGGFPSSEYRYEDIVPDTYDFRVRGVNNIGWVSDWITESNVLIEGKAAAPPDVSSLTFNNGVLEWTYENEPLDLAGFEVRYADNTDATWEDAVKLHSGLVSHSKYYLGFTPASEAIFFVKARDDSRNYSVNAAIATVSATPGGTLQLVDIVSDTITRSGIFTSKFHGAFTTNNYVTFLGDDTNDDKSPPQGTLSATSIFGATLAQCYAIGDGATQLYLAFTSMLDPNIIEGVEYRWNTSDPWQSITQNSSGQQDVLGDRWRLVYDVGSLFGSQLSPGGNGGIYLRLSQATSDSVSVTLAEWTSGGNDRVGATTASHSDGANGTLSNTSVGGATLAGIYTNQASTLTIAFEGDTTSNHPFEKLFITGTSSGGSGNRTVKRSQIGAPLYLSGDDLTVYIFTQNDIGFNPEFTGATSDIETVNFYS